MSLEIYCDKLDVFRFVFDNILDKKNNASIAKVLLSNSALLKLDNEHSKQNLSWSEFSFVSNLVDDDTAHITADFLCHHVSSLKKAKKKKLNINKSKIMAFLS